MVKREGDGGMFVRKSHIFDKKTRFFILECPFFGGKIPEKVFREILKVGCGRGGGRGRRQGRIEKIRKNSRKMTDFS